MTRMYKPDSLAEQSAFVRTHCRLCPRQLGCTILADARPLDPTDPDYPDELVLDDVGRPSCTAFAAAVDPAADERFPPVAAPPLGTPAAAEASAATPAPATSGTAPRRGRAAAAIAAAAARDGRPIVIAGALRGVTITTRTARDGSSETTTLRLQLAGGAR